MGFFDNLTENDEDEYLDSAECEGLISFSDFIELLELFTKETSTKVAEYLVGCEDFLKLDFYTYEIADPTKDIASIELVFSPSKYNSCKDSDPTENFLEDTWLENGVKDYWIYYWKIADLLSLKCIEKLKLDDENFMNYRAAMVGGAHTAIYYQNATKILIDKVNELQKIIDSSISTVPAKEEKNSIKPNGSLASYMTEYTLPQVVALILAINLSDISTSKKESSISNEADYNERHPEKFQQLLQTYSSMAINHQPTGINLVTYGFKPYNDVAKVYPNLEKTTIKKVDLTNYLHDIGYSLDELIAQQKPINQAANSQHTGNYQDNHEVVNRNEQLAYQSLTKELNETKSALEKMTLSEAEAQRKVKELSRDLDEANRNLHQKSSKPDEDVLQTIFDESYEHHAPDLKNAAKLWIDLYIHDKVGGNSHTGRADNWISKFTNYDAETTKADQRSIDRIREIATPLKDFGTKRSKEVKK